MANRIIWWIVGSLFVVVLTLTGSAYTSLQTQISILHANDIVRGERISALEAQSRATEQRWSDLNARLDRLENKIDKALMK